jgi:acyl-coenzyme A thioesterase PaaI-like protein
MIRIDMAKAVEIQRDRIRVARQPLLAALDVEFMRAVERGDRVEEARVVAEKRRLRDLPADPRLASVETPEELAVILP